MKTEKMEGSANNPLKRVDSHTKYHAVSEMVFSEEDLINLRSELKVL
ncbi:hypothetical protein IBE10_09125 [Francisella tularensis subsp. novicida]|nr:hypothetical protein [Francisella tularensis]APC96176.1 hypothetical protein KX02_1851 [Francisella tularensis subsp. novicida]MBK2347077.1 hypothetical protein [Francisella tularensis subsp. novicida]